MARWKKTVIGPGGYQTPDGAQVVDRARARRWADALNAMIEAGHRPPVSWGHVSSAVPASDDDAAFWASAMIAGKVLGASFDDRTGEVSVSGDTPGAEMDEQGRLKAWTRLPDGREVLTSIEEVSIGARDWTDGTGRLWSDAPIHVALTPLPVWVPEGGQPPFQPEAATAPAPATYFSSARVLYRFGSEPMADDDKPDNSGPPKEGEEGAAEGERPIKDVLAALAKVGLTLPEDTTSENLGERIIVAATALSGQEDVTSNPEQTTPPVTEEAGAGAGGAFMSTIGRDPTVAALIARLDTEDREKRLKRIEALEKRGLPAFKAKALREEATAARFSIGPDRQPVKQSVDEKLALLEEVLPRDGYPALFGTVPDVKEETPPEGETNENTKAARIAEEQARHGGLKRRGA